MSESLLFALSSQDLVPDSSSVLLVSVVLSWSSSISRCALRTKLASDFLFLQAWTAALTNQHLSNDHWGQANPDPTANAKILVIRFDNFTFIILDGAVSLFQLLA